MECESDSRRRQPQALLVRNSGLLHARKNCLGVRSAPSTSVMALVMQCKRIGRCEPWQQVGKRRAGAMHVGQAMRRTIAAARFCTPNALTTGSGIRSPAPPILKFCSDLCVCAPQYLKTGDQSDVLHL